MLTAKYSTDKLKKTILSAQTYLNCVLISNRISRTCVVVLVRTIYNTKVSFQTKVNVYVVTSAVSIGKFKLCAQCG